MIQIAVTWVIRVILILIIIYHLFENLAKLWRLCKKDYFIFCEFFDLMFLVSAAQIILSVVFLVLSFYWKMRWCYVVDILAYSNNINRNWDCRCILHFLGFQVAGGKSRQFAFRNYVFISIIISAYYLFSDKMRHRLILSQFETNATPT